MQKYLLLSLLATILGLLPLHAQEFTQGDFTFTVLGPEAKTVAVTGCTLPENSDVTIPATATLDDTEYTVTSLDRFYHNFSSIYIPESIESIYELFFTHCNVSDNIYVDNNNKNFTSINGALYSKDMTQLYAIPRNTTTIDISEGVTTIKQNACCYSNISIVSLPQSLQRIERSAFFQCENLTQIELPSNLEFIGNSAFFNCPLYSIFLPEKTFIESRSAFNYGTFIEVHSNNPNYSYLDACLYSKDFSTLIACPSGIDKITFPSETTIIGQQAFEHSCIKKITIPNSVLQLEESAFYNSDIEEITIPESITEISEGVFSHCGNLKKVRLPESLEIIGSWAFDRCENIGTIIIPKNVNKISASAFLYCGNAKIIITNKDTEIIDDIDSVTDSEPQATYYIDSKSNASTRLWHITQEKCPEIKINNFPNLFTDSLALFIGPNSQNSTLCTTGLDPACGFQADFTLPKGLNLYTIESEIPLDFNQLGNGDYRLICYTSDNTTIKDLALNFIFLSDENLIRSKLICHNIILSVEDQQLCLDDIDIPISGYDIDFSDIPTNLEEGDVITLTNPLSKEYQDVSFEWYVDETVGKITDNQTLHLLSPGHLSIGINLFDPEIGHKEIGTGRTITPALWGDSNSSGSIELADVVTTVNHILERNPEPFNAKLADVDRNGRINIVDVTSTVKLVLEQPIPDTPESDIQGTPAARELAFSEISRLENGKNILSLNLKPNADYTALQTDLEVPADVAIEAISLGESLSRHTVDYATVAPGVTRVILYSPSLTELAAGEEQPVLNITLGELPANGSIRTLRTLACDAQGQSFTLGNTEKEFYTTTGISSAATASYSVRAIAGGIEISGAEGAAITVSDLQGRTVATSEGTTTATRLSLAPGVYLVSAAGQHPAKVLVK